MQACAHVAAISRGVHALERNRKMASSAMPVHTRRP
jgi:hypothetical protein